MLYDLLRGGDFSSVAIQFAILAIIVFISLPVHEFAHAYAAHKLGDDTAKYDGRLTLNPFAHLSLMGTIMLAVVGVGYAKPVPVNSWNFKNKKRDMAFTALAGPVSNLIMSFAAILILKILSIFFRNAFVDLAFYYFAIININLAIFNLIPIPPLDGSRIFGALLPDKYYYSIQKYEQISSMILMGVLLASAFLRLNIFGTIIGIPSTAIFSAFSYIIDLPFKLLGV